MAFFYDIFWVFISPIFFGTSVMASVATSIDLPMKFIFPSLVQSLNTPLLKCSLLGLGDILLPGVIIKYILKYEKIANKGFRLYITSIIGYISGLLICISSLVIYQTA
jgi:signal peptide peptidase-like protein 2B